MKLIDRYILTRFAVNFAILFLLLFLFGSTIDVILNLDEFVDAARERHDDQVGAMRRIVETIIVAFDYEAPKLFQFYGMLHGMVAVGAMGFTLAQMYRYKELVAIMATGISLHRVAMPFVIAMFGLSLLQLLNQEWLMPRVAPLVLRSHSQAGEHGVEAFQVAITPGRDGTLLQAASFNPQTEELTFPTFIERDASGATSRRVTADTAVWDTQGGRWLLQGGQVTIPDTVFVDGRTLLRQPIDSITTDLTPELLLVRRYRQFASMLSLEQIDRMIRSGTISDVDSLIRFRYARFASVLVSMLLMIMTLPSFLLREPASLFKQSMICSAITMPIMLMSFVLMTVKIGGLPPAVSVFMPAIFMLPLALARVTFIRT